MELETERIELENGVIRFIENPKLEEILEGKSENFKERYLKRINARVKYDFKYIYKNRIKFAISNNIDFAGINIDIHEYSKEQILKIADFARSNGYKVTLIDCEDYRIIYDEPNDADVEFVNHPRIIFDWSDNPQIKINYIKEQTEEYLKSIENVKIN